MKSAIFIVLFLFTTSLCAQVISGKVVNDKKEPLAGVNVFFDGTTIGAVTDRLGIFTINQFVQSSSILVVSCLGYQSLYLSGINFSKELNITLLPQVVALNEVQIKSDGFTRKQKMKLFKEQFLGASSISKKIVIQNEDDIRLRYNKQTKTLEAFVYRPLMIFNYELGYKITYELVKFEAHFSTLSISSKDVTKSYYSGLSLFENHIVTPAIIKKRLKVFQGSHLQFFRNLASNSWGKDQFLLFKGSWQADPNVHFKVSDSLGIKKVVVTNQLNVDSNLPFFATFNVLYKKNSQSKVTFKTSTFFIDRFGNNTDIENIYFSGDLGDQKVGTMLPIDFGL
ncbi:carboxypeptidase-like regulatory domain-containing protein [Flavobacterium turcicum]|uniref:Carboxypeptidase-like regulatory domain-containing protein n=1 Tax=Flavobacterium turcicum TaxID=2764718 RepID=A0ABR7JJ90_9FLAO|nr:carboxypeptidase-like regulatory domain-containing protein [Flavobacterium turcicum]MBC5864570.1 carboxypeptidase-like regulatory domain-containing protein [Flavobacterium turcicum]NHL03293.1 hypothetical protein [Flavobacterium turcicum]